jgi:hypothetical protein
MSNPLEMKAKTHSANGRMIPPTVCTSLLLPLELRLELEYRIGCRSFKGFLEALRMVEPECRLRCGNMGKVFAGGQIVHIEVEVHENPDGTGKHAALRTNVTVAFADTGSK